MIEMIQCSDCAGTGAQIVNTGLMPEHGNLEQESCDRCGGTGETVQRHCSTCRTETDGAPLCDRCAWQMRRDCKVTRLAITAGACVGSGTVRNLQRDEELLAEYDEYQAREAKLIPLPAGTATLRAEVYRFEEERGCAVTDIEVAKSGFITMCRLTGLAGLAMPVRLEEETRSGHAVLVGARR